MSEENLNNAILAAYQTVIDNAFKLPAAQIELSFETFNPAILSVDERQLIVDEVLINVPYEDKDIVGSIFKLLEDRTIDMIQLAAAFCNATEGAIPSDAWVNDFMAKHFLEQGEIDIQMSYRNNSAAIHFRNVCNALKDVRDSEISDATLQINDSLGALIKKLSPLNVQNEYPTIVQAKIEESEQLIADLVVRWEGIDTSSRLKVAKAVSEISQIRTRDVYSSFRSYLEDYIKAPQIEE